MLLARIGVLASGGSGGDFELIETQTVGAGGAATITFGSGGTIPQTYKHLQIRTIGRTTDASMADGLVRFNGDTSTANYVAYHYVYGNGATAGSGNALTGVMGGMGIDNYLPGTGTTSTIFNATVIDVLDYTSTSKNKTARALNGYDSNGAGVIALLSGLWLSTAAITSITMLPRAGNFAQFSTFSLYGVK